LRLRFGSNPTTYPASASTPISVADGIFVLARAHTYNALNTTCEKAELGAEWFEWAWLGAGPAKVGPPFQEDNTNSDASTEDPASDPETEKDAGEGGAGSEGAEPEGGEGEQAESEGDDNVE
jgi:hypothetical protein